MKQLKIENRADTTNARVYREETTTYIAQRLRRMDVLVDFGDFGIGIENKPRAAEQEHQVRDYIAHLEGRYRERFLLVYLSGSGAPPKSVTSEERERREGANQLRVLDYSSGLGGWIDACLAECGAVSVRQFLRDFREYVREGFPPDGRGE